MTQQHLRIVGDHAKPLPRRINFTESSLAGLKCPPAKGRVYVYDGKVPCLACQVTAAGSKSYYYVGRVRGEQQSIKHRIGDFAKLSLDGARRAAQRIAADAADGINPAVTVRAARTASRHTATLGDVWERYRDDHLKVKCQPSTVTSDTSLWNLYLVGWEKRAINAIKSEDVAELHERITRKARAAGKTGNAADKAVKLLRRMLTFWKVTPNPAVGAVEFHGDEERQRFLTADEAARLFAALDGCKYTKVADAIRFALFTGARQGNVCGARWQDIHLDSGIWIIPADQSKNRKPMTINLPSPAVDLLTHRKAAATPDAVYVFPGHVVGRPLTTVARAWQAVRVRAKIVDVRLHDLRHTLASHMAMSGASLLVIGKQLGHASKQSTARYAHLEVDAVRAAAAAGLARFAPAAATDKPSP